MFLIQKVIQSPREILLGDFFIIKNKQKWFLGQVAKSSTLQGEMVGSNPIGIITPHGWPCNQSIDGCLFQTLVRYKNNMGPVMKVVVTS